MRTLLVTGGAGGVASQLRPYLRGRYRVRFHDLRVPAELAASEEVLVGDLGDPGVAEAAMAGADAVPQPHSPVALATWLSARDLAQLVDCAVTGGNRFGVFFAMSANTRGNWVLDSARDERATAGGRLRAIRPRDRPGSPDEPSAS